MTSNLKTPESLTPEQERALDAALVRLNERAWGLVLGALCGLILFLATTILVVRGGSPVGPHLALLGVYLRGYSVTWSGACVGLLYGFALGYVTGWTIGAIYNRLVKLG